MKTMAIIGPLGSGKTTLVNAVLAFLSNLRVLVVVNDVGTENIDASRIRNTGDIKALTAGCIGCSDLPAFQRVIREAQQSADSIDVLLIEPTGIADGKEIRDAVVGAGEKFHAITLVDVKHFKRNRALGCMENQLEVASVVGLTWTNEETQGDVLEFIGRHATGRPIFQNAFANIPELVEQTLKDKPRCFSIVPAVKCSCGHEHHHGEHVHTHDHGVYSFSLRLSENTTHADLVTALAPHLSYLVRAKGVVNGRQFDFVQGDLSLGDLSTDDPHGNFIFTKQIETETVFGRIALAPDTKVESKKERLRNTGVPLEDTLAAIEWQLGEFPPVVTPSGDLRVDCEADVVYQLAKRNGVPMNVRKETMNRYLSWRLEGARVLESGRWEQHPQLPYWKRRLGANLGYMCAVYPDVVDEGLSEKVEEIRPADLLAEGLLGITELSFDEEMAEERPETVAKAFAFGKKSELMEKAIVHCMMLSEKNPTWHARWIQLLT